MPSPKLWIPWGVDAPKGWSDPHNPVTSRRSEMVVAHDPRDHKEKAAAVMGVVGGQEVVVVGGGAEWTEDQKDMIERMAEDEHRNAAEIVREAFERREAVRNQWLKSLDAKITHLKKNWRTGQGTTRNKTLY